MNPLSHILRPTARCSKFLWILTERWRFKKGDPVKIENILAVEDVFSDAKNGDRPAEQDIVNAFGQKMY